MLSALWMVASLVAAASPVEVSTVGGNAWVFHTGTSAWGLPQSELCAPTMYAFDVPAERTRPPPNTPTSHDTLVMLGIRSKEPGQREVTFYTDDDRGRSADLSVEQVDDTQAVIDRLLPARSSIQIVVQTRHQSGESTTAWRIDPACVVSMSLSDRGTWDLGLRGGTTVQYTLKSGVERPTLAQIGSGMFALQHGSMTVAWPGW